MYSGTTASRQPSSPFFDPGTPTTSTSTTTTAATKPGSKKSILDNGSYFSMTPSAIERSGFDFSQNAAASGTKRRTPPSSSSSNGTASMTDNMSGSGYFSGLKLQTTASGMTTPHSPYKHFRPSPSTEQPPHPSATAAASNGDTGPVGLAALDQFNARLPVTSPSSFVIPSIASPVPRSESMSATSSMAPKLSLPPFSSPSSRAGGPVARKLSTASAPDTGARNRSTSTSIARYSAMTAEDLLGAGTANRSLTDYLVLDIRPRSSWSMCRLAGSLNISIPSTLMRRATHTIDRVQDSLSEDEQIIFARWQSCKVILVIDTESTALLEGSPVASLLSKFANAGFQGTLAWLKGGFAAVLEHIQQKQPGLSSLLDYGSSEDQVMTPGSASSGSRPAVSRETSASSISSTSSRPVLSVRDLPQAAFQQSSTSAFAHSSEASSMRSEAGQSSRRASLMSGMPTSQPMRLSLSSSSGSGTSGSSGGDHASRRMATNPFFDNIRQNAEYLSLERSMANLQPVELPNVDEQKRRRLPVDLQVLLDLSPMDRARKLARQFYELEVTERSRLEGAFNWQASSSSSETSHRKYAKYGISAGFELGNLNRFKNIFPYEHTRVKLSGRTSRSATDYINASHVRFKGSSKQFIASQGPLKSTFDDFWQMIDQERCGVIVMLTNLQEGGREKCSRYWMPGKNSTWDIESQLESGEIETDAQDVNCGPTMDGQSSGDYFSTARAAAAQSTAAPSAASSSSDTHLVRRLIRAKRRLSPPGSAPRKVRHLHYRAWPDFDLPASPEDIVSLIREVDEAQRAYMQEIGWTDTEREPPILAHCSAGVGRTGVFIMVSTVLDKLRRNRQSMSIPRSIPDRLSSPVHAGSSPNGGGGRSTPDTVGLTAGFEAQSLRSQTASPVLSIDVSDDDDSNNDAKDDEPTPLGRRGSAKRKKLNEKEKPAAVPLDGHHPIFEAANEMRESRMSMIANYRQYVCVHECVLLGVLQDLEAGR